MDQRAPFYLYIAGKQHRQNQEDLSDDDFQLPAGEPYEDENGFEIEPHSIKGVKVAFNKSAQDFAENLRKNSQRAFRDLKSFVGTRQDQREESKAQAFSDIASLKDAIFDAQKEFNLSAVVFICTANKTPSEIEKMPKWDDYLKSCGVITICSEMTFERFVAAWQRETISLTLHQPMQPEIFVPQVTCVIKGHESEESNGQSEVPLKIVRENLSPDSTFCYIEKTERFERINQSKKMAAALTADNSVFALGTYSFSDLVEYWPRDAFHITIYNETNQKFFTRSVGSVREVAEILSVMKANKSDKSNKACASLEYRYLDVSSGKEVQDEAVLPLFTTTTSLKAVIRGRKDCNSFDDEFVNEQMFSDEVHQQLVNLARLTKHIFTISVNAKSARLSGEAGEAVLLLKNIHEMLVLAKMDLKSIDAKELSCSERNNKLSSAKEAIANSIQKLKQPNCLSALKKGFQEKLQADINNFEWDKQKGSAKLCDDHDVKIKNLQAIKKKVDSLRTESDRDVSQMLNLLRKMSRLSGEVVCTYLQEQQILEAAKTELVSNTSLKNTSKKAVASSSDPESQERLIEDWKALQQLKCDAKRQYPKDKKPLNQLNPFLLCNVFHLIDVYYYLVLIVKRDLPPDKKQNLLECLNKFITELVRRRYDINTIKRCISNLRNYFKQCINEQNKLSPEVQNIQNILGQIDKGIQAFDQDLISEIETQFISALESKFSVKNHKVSASTAVSLFALSEVLENYGIELIKHDDPFVVEINTKNIAFDPMAVDPEKLQQNYTAKHKGLCASAKEALEKLKNCIEKIVGKDVLHLNVPEQLLVLEISAVDEQQILAIKNAVETVIGSDVKIQIFSSVQDDHQVVQNRQLDISIQIVVDPRGLPLRWKDLESKLQHFYREQLQNQNPVALDNSQVEALLSATPTQNLANPLLNSGLKAPLDRPAKRLKYQRQSSSVLTSPATWLVLTFLIMAGGMLWKEFAFSSFSLVSMPLMCLTTASMAAAAITFLACTLSFEEKMIDSEGNEVTISETAIGRYFKNLWEWMDQSPVCAGMFLLTAIISLIWVIVSLSLSLPGFSELVPYVSQFLRDLFPVFDLVVSNATLIANLGLGALVLLTIDLSMRVAMAITSSQDREEVISNELDHPKQPGEPQRPLPSPSPMNGRGEYEVGSPEQEGYNPVLNSTQGENEEFQQPLKSYNPFATTTNPGAS